MTEEARSAMREYHKKWREANRDKIRANQERYWQRKAQENAENAGHDCQEAKE